jgi:hypothetical protein
LTSSYLADTLDLADRGFAVIPTTAGSKRAAVSWKPYQERRPTRRELHHLFDRSDVGGLAVVLGKVSGGLACRDFDTNDSYHAWARQHPDLAAELPTVQTFRGRHVYFHTDEECFVPLDDGEFRADSKHYCLCPTSAHPQGGRYEWITPLPSGQLPRIDDPVAAGLLPLDDGEQVNTRGINGGDEEGEGRRRSNTPPVVVPPEVTDIDGVLYASLPPGPGHRHRYIFALARRLKGHPGYGDADVADVLPLVERWHRLALPAICTKDYEVTRRDFLDAWRSIKFPAGCRWLDRLWNLTSDYHPGPARLARLCELMQARTAGNFFLSCRTVGRLAGYSQVTAWKWLKKLEATGVLTRVSTGEYRSRKANEYRLGGQTPC